MSFSLNVSAAAQSSDRILLLALFTPRPATVDECFFVFDKSCGTVKWRNSTSTKVWGIDPN